MIKIHRFAKWISLCAIVFCTTGCETLTSGSPASKKKKKDASWSLFKKKEYQIPQSMNVTWAHDVITLPGKPPTRGFGGRFYFYNEKTQAIPVDGDLVVYGFDDTNKQPLREDELSQADKRFRFTAEQFTTHFSEGELGASYSVWIPWDEAYGAPKKIMLIPTFMTKDGRLIRGASANLNLPGKSNDDNTPGLILQASATIPTALPGQIPGARQRTIPAGQTPSIIGTQTTTIQVPSNSSIGRPNSSRTVGDASSMGNADGQSQIDMQNQWIQEAQRQISYANAMNASTANVNPAVTQGSAISAQSVPQSTSMPATSTSNRAPQIYFDPPVLMPPMRANVQTNNPNGWALPEFSQGSYSGLAPRSSLSSPQVPATQGVQPTSYPTR